MVGEYAYGSSGVPAGVVIGSRDVGKHINITLDNIDHPGGRELSWGQGSS